MHVAHATGAFAAVLAKVTQVLQGDVGSLAVAPALVAHVATMRAGARRRIARTMAFI